MSTESAVAPEASTDPERVFQVPAQDYPDVIGFPPPPVVPNPAPIRDVRVSANVDVLPRNAQSGTRITYARAPELVAAIGGAGGAQINTDGGIFFGNPVVVPSPTRAGSASQTVSRFVTTSPWVLLSGFGAPSSVFDGTIFIRVNGVPIWALPRTFAGTYDGHESGIYLEFMDTASKLVEITSGWLPSAINHEPGTLLTAPPVAGRKRLYVLGDSWTDGTGQGGPWVSWARYLQNVSAWDVTVQGLGGTGYVAGDATHAWTSPFGVAGRVNEAIAAAPDLLLVVGSINDGGASGVQSAAESILGRVAAGAPSTRVALIGPQIGSPQQVENLAQLRAAASVASNVIGVHDPVSAGWDVDGVRGVPGHTLGDPVHPTPAGVEWWGRRVEQWVRLVTSRSGDPSW